MTNVEGQPIVVGVDGSPSALHAVRRAAGEAARHGAPLRLVHVCYLMPVRHPRQVAPPPEYHDAFLEQGRHWLAEAADAARRAAPDVAVGTDLVDGIAADVLVRESAPARLVVLGTRGLGGFRGLLVGSVSVAVAAHGHCPVVVVHDPPGGTPREDGPVVVGVDGSPLSDAAIEFAFSAAAARRVPLVAVHSWIDVNTAGAWAGLPDTIDWEWLGEQEARRLDEVLASWVAKFPGRSARCSRRPRTRSWSSSAPAGAAR
jgi:nucleotide-binding universal stress UspA family protein